MRNFGGMWVFVTLSFAFVGCQDVASDGGSNPGISRPDNEVEGESPPVTDWSKSAPEARDKLLELGLQEDDFRDGGVILRPDWKGGDEGLVWLQQLPGLSKVYLESASISDGGMEHLVAIDNLTVLHLKYTDVTDDGLKELEKTPNLSYLLLAGENFSDDALPHVCRVKTLRDLRIAYTRISDKGINKNLGQLKDLERLELTENAAISDKALDVIPHLKKLKHLSVAGTSVSDRALRKLWDHLPELQIVSARGGLPAKKGGKLGTGLER